MSVALFTSHVSGVDRNVPSVIVILPPGLVAVSAAIVLLLLAMFETLFLGERCLDRSLLLVLRADSASRSIQHFVRSESTFFSDDGGCSVSSGCVGGS